MLFSSTTTPADTAACLAAVDLLEGSEILVEKLWENARYLQQGVQSLGFDTGNSQTPTLPIMLGDAGTAKQFSRSLFDNGVFAMGIGFPTVRKVWHASAL